MRQGAGDWVDLKMPVSSASLNAGSYSETYAFTPADTSDYVATTGSVAVNVAPALLSLTAQPRSRPTASPTRR